MPKTVLLALLLVPALASAAETHQVTTTGARATPGQAALASVTIQGKNGWHVNEEAPISLKLAPGPGVAVDKPKLARADLAENTKDRARFDVKLTANEPGAKTVAAEANFVMCQATACQPVKETLTLALEVADAAKAEPTTKPAPASKSKGKSRKN